MMMIFQRMHLALENGIVNVTVVDEVYKYSGSSNLESFKQDQ